MVADLPRGLLFHPPGERAECISVLRYPCHWVVDDEMGTCLLAVGDVQEFVVKPSLPPRRVHQARADHEPVPLPDAGGADDDDDDDDMVDALARAMGLDGGGVGDGNRSETESESSEADGSEAGSADAVGDGDIVCVVADAPASASDALPPLRRRPDFGSASDAVFDAVRLKTRRLRDETDSAATNNRARVPLEAGMISLVTTTDGDVLFVRWTSDVRTYWARPVSLDERDRIKTIVACAVQPQCFATAEIVIAQTGAVMIVTSQSSRPPMPPWCLKLFHQKTIQSFAGPLLRSEHVCIVCEAAVEHCSAYDKARMATELLFGCHVCTSVWHSGCSIAFGASSEFGTPWVCPICLSDGL